MDNSHPIKGLKRNIIMSNPEDKVLYEDLRKQGWKPRWIPREIDRIRAEEALGIPQTEEKFVEKVEKAVKKPKGKKK